MQIYTPDKHNLDQKHRRLRLEEYYLQAEAVILSRQDPITGLLPASTAITVHGDYTDAWVRDNVYSILAIWGLALAYRRQDNDEGKAYRLEQSVVKLMRGLLIAMMKQSAKVERFKHTQDPLDALHAKYDTRSGEAVVGDEDWGHLQLDATSLFLLMLAQMTASGLRIIFTQDEVDFVQNLVHYLSRAYRTPDYGLWERGHKMNEGVAEINASSLGMAKAALEALSGFDLFGIHGGPDSVIQVLADDVARARSTLEALLPRESNSKEIDAALLSVIGFPAFAVEDIERVERTRAEIITKLQGRYGCKRFLRDGHQTVLEDHSRLHYEAGELRQFEHIESEWPLFLTYLLLDGILGRNPDQAREYRERLDQIGIERDGQRLLPELYYVPAERIAQEKAQPHSQVRLPNDNVPLVWAQSLFLLGILLQEEFIHPADIDPLGRRWRLGRHRDTRIQLALVAEDAAVQAQLEDNGILAQTPEQVQPVQLRHPDELTAAFAELGRNRALDLSGRPRYPLGSLVTSQVFTRGGETLVFLPPFLNQRNFYLQLDNRLLVEQLKAELTYIHRHWDQPGQPLLTLLITGSMLQAGGHQVLLELMKGLQGGWCNGARVRVAKLAEHLPTAGRARIDYLPGLPSADSTFQIHPHVEVGLEWQESATRPLSAAEATAWRQESDLGRLLQGLGSSRNPYEHIELLGLLWERVGPDFVTEPGGSIRQLTEAVYARASQARLWGVIRRAAGLLEKVDETLEDAVAEMVACQHQLSVGRAYSSEAVISRPLNNAEIVVRIRAHGGDDPRGRVLIQEIVLFLGMLIKVDPSLFKGTLTLRAWHLLLLITGQIAQERGVTEGEAFEQLLEMSPHAILTRLHQVIVNFQDMTRYLARLESLYPEGQSLGLTYVRFPASDNPTLVDDGGGWKRWREINGVLTRLPEDFYTRVWEILQHCRGLVIGERLDIRNRLDSELLQDMTPAEKEFALRVEELLNNIHAPEYRQLTIEALLALSDILKANPRLRLSDDIVLEALIDNAVRLAWLEAHPEKAQSYNEHLAWAWDALYISPPHRVANAIMASLAYLLEGTDQQSQVAA